VASSLNHPNIAAIYDLAAQDQSQFLVLELVGGETLAERIARGPVPVDEALNIAKQIAEALEAAHEKGVIHRDLKPANIKITPDGVVKVLDFGLAKEIAASPADDLSTMQSDPTRSGMIVGTAAYMAPEQARGKPVDKRADIWAFGAVIYEMLTGRRAFIGETTSDTLAAVLQQEPDWNRVPVRFRLLTQRCLERDAKRRLRDIGDARWELDQTSVSEVATSSARSARSWKRSLSVLSAAIILSAATGAIVWRIKPTPVAHLRRFELPGMPVTEAALSPDGSRIAYLAGGHLRLRSLETLQVQDLAPVKFRYSWRRLLVAGRTKHRLR
jgi:serine/threonine-protein kinase